MKNNWFKKWDEGNFDLTQAISESTLKSKSSDKENKIKRQIQSCKDEIASIKEKMKRV